MFRTHQPKFRISICREALESVFDECDQFDLDETGGRILGTYHRDHNEYQIEVLGVIGPGPNAKRSPTSFFQDGHYQERIFRRIESERPEIEHLGNWHTHHVNGLQTLSSGDQRTYRATVDHQNHNTDFFYALLVTRKREDRKRYDLRHYVFLRDDDEIYEVPTRNIHVAERPAIWTRESEKKIRAHSAERDGQNGNVNAQRARDVEVFSVLYPGLRPLFSQKVSAMYWKGPLELIDGSRLDLVVLESPDSSYSITAASDRHAIGKVLEAYSDRVFDSARHAVLALERDINRALYTEVLRGRDHEHRDC